MISRNFTVLALACVLLTACSTYDDLQDSRVEGAMFHHELSREYRVIAEYEAEEMNDSGDAGYFAMKALDASKGYFVEPTLLGERDIEPKFLPELAHARAKLMKELHGRRDMPRYWKDLARAQAQFDCWAEQQEEGFQEEDIMACKGGFYAALHKVCGHFRGEQAFIIFFDHNSSKLDPAAVKAVALVADVMKSNPDLKVTLTGNTDTSGAEAYNKGLGLRRAKAVRKALLAEGVSKESAKVFSEGESNPLVQTEDGIRERKNRRVDILVTKK